ncbi:hypothetical protein SteCoe_2681 [Stentor coeruleus]|uniref:Uncharacterized protein n=1 Tax=Stentor coeruleus TaxID=5963 RepID=A0A1R2CYX1_9CILI|nr:hypothetical protein SteCoe_2681 [Stentor coeruleus]
MKASVRKSDRKKEYDPEIMKDLKDLCGPRSLKKHIKRLNQKKRKAKRAVSISQMDSVLGFATLIRESEPVLCKSATHVSIAYSIQSILNKNYKL